MNLTPWSLIKFNPSRSLCLIMIQKIKKFIKEMPLEVYNLKFLVSVACQVTSKLTQFVIFLWFLDFLTEEN